MSSQREPQFSSEATMCSVDGYFPRSFFIKTNINYGVKINHSLTITWTDESRPHSHIIIIRVLLDCILQSDTKFLK
jgi:hypothetical protein